MEFRDTPDQAQFRAAVQTFLQTEAPDYFRQNADAGEGMGLPEDEAGRAATEEWRKRVAGKGWIAPNWPQQYGGAGLTVTEQFVMNEEFAWAGVPHPGGMGVMMAGPTIIAHGSEAQQQAHLSGILSGESVWCQGFSEPGAGSDLASVQTRAVRDGDDYVINGQKIWTSGAHLANWIFMLTRTDPDAPKHRGITFLLAPMTAAGITVRPLRQMTGDAYFNEVFFEDVRTPVRNRIGEENRGWYVGTTTLDFERSSIGSSVGVVKTITKLAGIARESGALRQRPSVRHELADRLIEANVGILLSKRIGWMQARGLIPNMEASMNKLFSSEMRQRIALTGMHVGGLLASLHDKSTPYAAADQGRLAHGYLSAVAATIAGGTSEIQRGIIATRGLGMPRG